MDNKNQSDVLVKNISCSIIRKTKSCPEFSLAEIHTSKKFPELFLEEDVYVPRLAVWILLDFKQINDLIKSERDNSLNYLCCLLKSKGYTGLNLKFMSTYLYDALNWALENKLRPKKLSSFLGILYNTHTYFLASPDRNPQETYKFCRESLVLHSIEFPPKAERIFNAFESRNSLLYFCETYLPLLPLLRVSLLPNYRLEIKWQVPMNVSSSEKRISYSQKKK